MWNEKVTPIMAYSTSWLYKLILIILVWVTCSLYFLEIFTTHLSSIIFLETFAHHTKQQNPTLLIKNVTSKSLLKEKKKRQALARGAPIHVTYNDLLKLRHHVTVEGPFYHSWLAFSLNDNHFASSIVGILKGPSLVILFYISNKQKSSNKILEMLNILSLIIRINCIIYNLLSLKSTSSNQHSFQ